MNTRSEIDLGFIATAFNRLGWYKVVEYCGPFYWRFYYNDMPIRHGVSMRYSTAQRDIQQLYQACMK